MYDFIGSLRAQVSFSEDDIEEHERGLSLTRHSHIMGEV